MSSIKNLGPAFEAACARAGIHSANEVRALGPDETYRRVLAAGARPHFIGFYVLVMGLQGRPWNDCQGKEKEALRARFDALVGPAPNRDTHDMVTTLDSIGVRVSAADLIPTSGA